jgi:predicted RNA-binding Zn ribbon-like protein
MEDFRFLGGDLALDFLNTVADRFGHPRERFVTGADVDRWARRAGLLGPRDSLRLGARGLAHVRQARDTLYALMQPVALGQAPSAATLGRFNVILARCARERHLSWQNGRLEWRWKGIVGPVFEHAGELLTAGPSNRLRQCADAVCGWMFLDRSPAGQRRWCSMDDCGNRAKARRHYQRGRRANLPTLDE